MAEPLKNLINDEVVRQAGHHLQRVWPAFDRPRFEALSINGLQALAFKDRARHLGRAMESTLPDDFHLAADVLQAALKPVQASSIDPDKELGLLKTDEHGLAGWVLWPVGEFVVQRGLAHPERALQLLHAVTQRFTAEFAIRPFIVAHPELCFATLARWVHDPSAHVRRLVSEGSRPRLPWGLRLQSLVKDPSPTLPLLAALQDDPSEYVRRSVANHLNDIAKDHPDLLADWLATHLPTAAEPRRRLLRHASRTLIKQGHVGVLGHWGLGTPLLAPVHWAVSPAEVSLGDRLQLSLGLQSRAPVPQTLEIDYTVHHVKANGQTSPKTFKGWKLTLAPGQSVRLTKAHAVRPISTRQYHPGTHAVDVHINGQVLAQAAFDLSL